MATTIGNENETIRVGNLKTTLKEFLSRLENMEISKMLNELLTSMNDASIIPEHQENQVLVYNDGEWSFRTYGGGSGGGSIGEVSLWGNRFDGTQSIGYKDISNVEHPASLSYVQDITMSGNIKMNRGQFVQMYVNNDYRNVLGTDSTNPILSLGYRTAEQGFDTRIFGTDVRLWYYNATDKWKEGVTLTNTGKVGIGTTAPQYKLDVNGTAHVSSDITAWSEILMENNKFIRIKNAPAQGATAEYVNMIGLDSSNRFSVFYGALKKQYTTGIYGYDVNIGHGNDSGQDGAKYFTVFRNNGHVTINAYDDTDATRNVFLNVGGSTKTNRLYLFTSSSGDVYLEYDNVNKGVRIVGAGLYADTYVSALGTGSDGTPGGIDLEAMWDSLTHHNDSFGSSQIDANHLKNVTQPLTLIVNGVEYSYNGINSVNLGEIGGDMSNLFTKLENDGDKISVTVGGTNKELTVGYATTANKLRNIDMSSGDNYDALGGYTKERGSFVATNWLTEANGFNSITLDGKGLYDTLVSFGYNNRTIQLKGSGWSDDLKYRHVYTKPGTTNEYVLSPWKTIAFTDSTVAKAERLSGDDAKKAWGRTYWNGGQPQDVEGNIENTFGITPKNTNTYSIGTRNNWYASLYASYLNMPDGASGVGNDFNIRWWNSLMNGESESRRVVAMYAWEEINGNGTGADIILGSTDPKYGLYIDQKNFSVGICTDSLPTDTRLYVNGNIRTGGGNGSFIQIGQLRIVYEDSTRSLKVVDASNYSAAANFYATGAVSALGQGSTGGASTFDEEQMWGALGKNAVPYKDRKIDNGHLNLSSLTIITKSGSTIYNPTGDARTVDLSNLTGDYLPLNIPSGGSTVTMPSIGGLAIKNASNYPLIRFDGNTECLGFLGFGKTGGNIHLSYVTPYNNGYDKDHSQWYTLLHTGNFIAGNNISLTWNTDNKLVIASTYSYTLPTATSSTLGGVKVGGTMSIDSGGALNQKSGIIANTGTYRSVTVDTYGRVTAGSNPTTLSEYGISTKWWGQGYQTVNGAEVVEGDMTSVGNITMSGSITGCTGIDDTLYFDAANKRVGIGTSSPDYALDVIGQLRFRGSASSTSALSCGVFTNSGNPYIRFINPSGGNIDIYVGTVTNDNVTIHPLYIGSVSQQTRIIGEEVRIYSSSASGSSNYTPSIVATYGGRVLIGGNNTNTDYKLYVNGNIATSDSTGAYIKIGGAKLIWDGSALKCDKDFYSTGAVSALGTGSGGSSGGGIDMDTVWSNLQNNASGHSIGTSTNRLNALYATSIYANGFQVLTSSNGVMLDGSQDIIGTKTFKSNILAANKPNIGTNTSPFGTLYSDNVTMPSTTSQLSINGNQNGLVIKAQEIYNANAGISIQGTNSSNRNVSICAGGGNVGIGAAANTNYKLYVSGTGYFTDKVYIGKNDVYLTYKTVTPTTGTSLNFLNVCAAGLYLNGSPYNSSDIRKKNVEKNLDFGVEDVARAPIFDFTWKTGSDKLMHVGSSAQYWKPILPNAVLDFYEDGLALDYGATALAAAVMTARKVLDHEGRIRLLEVENQALRKEIEQLKKVA